MEEMKAKAYAKINLSLDILGKREDGYHLLKMVMQSISLYDEVTIKTGENQGIVLTCDDPKIPCDKSNTVYRAAELFFQWANISTYKIEICIHKNIPSQAGLGGGSADAAAVLKMLNCLYDTHFSIDTLCEIGLLVGADVPFCIKNGTMLCEGIGERLSPLPSIPNCWIVLCKPSVNVSTKEAYAISDKREFPGKFYTDHMMNALKEKKLSSIAQNLGNAFVDILQLPEIQILQEKMMNLGALGACMTGSGSVVFGIFEDKIQAENCSDQLKGEYREVFLCHPIF